MFWDMSQGTPLLLTSTARKGGMMQRKNKKQLPGSLNWLKSSFWQDDDARSMSSRKAIFKFIIAVAAIVVITTIAARLLPLNWIAWFIISIGAWYGAQFLRSQRDDLDGITKPAKQRHFKGIRREIIVNSSGTRSVRLSTWEKNKNGAFKQASYTLVIHNVTFDESMYIDERCVLRGMPMPILGEDRILYFQRLQWLSHGPRQMIVAALTILLTVGITKVTNILGGLGILVVGAFCYWCVRMPWSYKWLIITNQRVLLLYQPPLGLPGYAKPALFQKITSCNQIDRYLFKWLKCGTINGETAATVTDDWFREGVKWVKYHAWVVATINGQVARRSGS